MSKSNDGSVFLDVLGEIEQENKYFDLLVEDESEFRVFVFTTDDDSLIKFYYYLSRMQKIYEYKNVSGEYTDKLAKIEERYNALLSTNTIKKHINAQIEETVKIISEKQRQRRLKPFGKLFPKRSK